jgi:hypothetical protein
MTPTDPVAGALDPASRPATEASHGSRQVPGELWTGILHVYVAFDWGDEILLDRARRLVPAELHDLSRRRRTPGSFSYRPLPLRISVAGPPWQLPEIGSSPQATEVTAFDFGAVSVAFHIPFRLEAAALTRLATWLADPGPVLQAARAVLAPLYQRLLSAIQAPLWKEDLSEEYFVFQLRPENPEAVANALLASSGEWLAGLLRLDIGSFSDDEIAEALRLHLRYSRRDLLVVDWAAAVLLDQDCEETLQAIEFANLQLLELRHIDQRLDETLLQVYGMIHGLVKSRLPFWRSPARSLRRLGELQVEAYSLFERTDNVLKLVGDQYLARAHRLLANRFHLDEWEQSIQRKLAVIEGVYRIISDQADSYRTASLEVIVILLIGVEIVLAVFRH